MAGDIALVDVATLPTLPEFMELWRLCDGYVPMIQTILTGMVFPMIGDGLDAAGALRLACFRLEQDMAR